MLAALSHTACITTRLFPENPWSDTSPKVFLQTKKPRSAGFFYDIQFFQAAAFSSFLFLNIPPDCFNGMVDMFAQRNIFDAYHMDMTAIDG